MTHEFESEKKLIIYTVDTVEIHDEIPSKYQILTVMCQDKATGKYYLGAQSRNLCEIGKTEEELLALWKEKNDSKYIKSYT